jgi:hypothetical protein
VFGFKEAGKAQTPKPRFEFCALSLEFKLVPYNLISHGAWFDKLTISRTIPSAVEGQLTAYG